jgi:hypothetical protein
MRTFGAKANVPAGFNIDSLPVANCTHRWNADFRKSISKICVIRGFDWKFNAIRRGRLAHRQ